MPAGFQAWAQDGSGLFQIDGTYRNLFQRARGVVATSTLYFAISGGNVSYVAVQFGGGFQSRPLIALRCTALAAVGAIQQNPDGSWWAYVYVRGEVGTQFTWYAYDWVAGGEIANYGLVIWNPDTGQPVFDATKKAMRVVGTVASDGISGQTQTLPAGREYAVAANPGGRAVPTGPSAGVLMTFGASVNGGTIVLTAFQIATLAAGVVGVNGPVAGLILDVTNY